MSILEQVSESDAATTPIAEGHIASLSAEERYQLLVEAVSDYAIYLLDASGKISSWNSGAERFKGYLASEVIGRHFSLFYTPEDRERGEPERALATAELEGRFETEAWRVRKDGRRFWAHVVIDPIRDSKGRIIGFAKITRDNTERQAARDALLESERRFRILVQGVTDYAIYMLDPQGKITNWNPGAERIKGYQSSEIIGEHFSRFYTPEDIATRLPCRALETAEREGKFENEGWRVRKDGTRFWASVVIDAIRDETGQLIGFAKITRDVTERRRAAEALAETQEALFQAQKLEAIGQLTGGVAHDFNNLLTVIVSSLDLLKRKVSEPRDVRIVENALLAAERGAKLTNQLLAFARKQSLHLEEHNPNRLIDTFESILRRAVGDTMSVVVTLSVNMRAAMLDVSQFEVALLNLVVNARDACNGRGSIEISTAVEEIAETRRLVMSSIEPGAYVRISVSDNGEGMSEEVLARACEPFFTTKSIGQGTGLGLSQVYGFASQAGGHVDIRSREGEGTTVSIYLPAGERVQNAPEARRHDKTVLIVDDDQQVITVAIELFGSLGYEVLTAPDAIVAMDVLRRDTHIDLLFTDVVMPRGMSGIDLFQQARKLRPEMKVMLSSGFPLPALEKAKMQLADTAFIAKPYRWTELVERLRVLELAPS